MSNTTNLRSFGLVALTLAALSVISYLGYEQIERPKWNISDLRSENAKLTKELADFKLKPVTVDSRIIKEIRLTRLVLVDEEDNPLFTLERNGTSAVQRFTDTEGTKRLIVGTTKENASRVRLFDQNGSPLISMSAFDSNGKSTGPG